MRLAVCALSAVLLSACSGFGGSSGSSGFFGQNSGGFGLNCGVGGQGFQQASLGQGFAGSNGFIGGLPAECYGTGAGGFGGAGFGGAGFGPGGFGPGGAGFGGAGFGPGGAGFGPGGAGFGGAGFGPGGAGFGAGGFGPGAGFGGAGFGPGGAGFGAGAGFGGAGFGPGGAGFAPGVGGFGAGAGGFGPGAIGAGLAANGVGVNGFGANGVGVNGFGANGFGNVTTLGANAPFGAAVGGGQFVGNQFAGGAVQTVTGAPIFVPQAVGVPFGVPQLRGVSAALPFAIAGGIGTAFAADGNIFGGKDAGPASGEFGQPSAGRDVSAIESISYGDAFDNPINYDIGAEYDIGPSTTVLGRLGYSEADGQEIEIGSVTEGGVTAPLLAEFSDFEQFKIEGGVRQYLGGAALRPYVSALGGFVYNDDIDVTQTSAAFAGGPETIEFADGGWQPTAAGLVGAEWQVGPRTAIGVETGIRWRDGLDTNTDTTDVISIPLQLRGRVAF